MFSNILEKKHLYGFIRYVEQDNNICASGSVTFNPSQGLVGVSHTCAYQNARTAAGAQPELRCSHAGGPGKMMGLSLR